MCTSRKGKLTLRLDSEKATVYDISMSKSIEPIIEKLRECKELLQVPWIDDEDSSDEENDDDDDTDSYEDAHDSENDGESRRDRRNYSPQKDGEPPWEVFEIPESLDNSEEGRTLQLLDYACGTGLATRVSPARLHAWQLNLTRDVGFCRVYDSVCWHRRVGRDGVRVQHEGALPGRSPKAVLI